MILDSRMNRLLLGFIISALAHFWNTTQANQHSLPDYPQTTIELNAAARPIKSDLSDDTTLNETVANTDLENAFNYRKHSTDSTKPIEKSIDCGLQDITATPIRERNAIPNGLTHNQALKLVFNHLFKMPKKGEWESDNLLFYLKVLYFDNLGIELSIRERDLMLCTLLSNSTIEQYTDLATAGLLSYSNQEIYLFRLILKDKKYKMAHIWVTVNRFNGEANIIAIDD